MTQQESDLPIGLSAPARRALVGAGYSRLKQLSRLSEAELKKLHGALSAAETQITVLERKIRTLQSINEGTEILLPAELKATVKSFDPKWGFLILNAGSDQGIIKNAELLLSRDSKLVAKVKISSVQKGQSIANLVPGWQLTDVAEGDLAIPAHPRS